MHYYIWISKEGKPASKAWPYEDETERMVEQNRPPTENVVLRTGTKEQLKAIYHLKEFDFVDSK
jgi:hypothetical protein